MWEKWESDKPSTLLPSLYKYNLSLIIRMDYSMCSVAQYDMMLGLDTKSESQRANGHVLGKFCGNIEARSSLPFSGVPMPIYLCLTILYLFGEI